MFGPRGVPFLPGSVVPVVAGQVKLAEVAQRVTAMQFELGVDDPLLFLGRRQLSLIVRVREPLAVRPRLRQPGEPGADAGRRQVLRLAVVFVPAAVLPHLGHVEVAHRAHPRGKIHGPTLP